MIGNVGSTVLQLLFRLLVVFGVQAEGDVLLANQAILTAQCFFCHNLVHLLGILVTVISTQGQKGVAAELLLVHAAGDKVDLQMQ